MGVDIGSIFLNLKLNKDDFNSSLNSVKKEASTAGKEISTSLNKVKGSFSGLSKLLIAAFSIREIARFSASCLELGSNLAEVQNVVDVTFTSMSDKVNKFAKSAAISYGLSETMAKQFVGTVGAMAKAFSFSEQSAFDMGTSIAALSGDIASFYNISQDEAFTKLKSIFTGETESLKSLGVVMTQTALDSFAMANGFNKTTRNMSESEKVALRYRFVLDQLKGASGDFSRTSEGWANQVRILKLQFDSLKASIGQGLIQVLLPVIKTINILIGKLMSLASAFKSFTAMFGGGKKDGIASSVSQMDAVSKASTGASKALGGAGSAAKKAAKDIASATTGIDELNIIQKPSADSSAGGSDSLAGVSDIDTPKLNLERVEEDSSSLDTLRDRFTPIIEKAKELQELFIQGFKLGFSDSEVRIDNIKTSLINLKDTMKEIATDESVSKSFENFVDSFVLALGKITGSAASIGLTTADFLVGSVESYLVKNKGRIKKALAEQFDISSEMSKITSDFSVSFANIFKVFSSPSAKSIGGSITAIFTNAFVDVGLLVEKFARDVLIIITKPFTDNEDLIKDNFGHMLDVAAPILDDLADIFSDVGETLNDVYDKHIKPLMDSLANGLSEIVKVISTAWKIHIAPVLENLAKKFHEVKESAIDPLIDKVGEFIGKIADGIKEIWEVTLQPFITWLIEILTPILANVFNGAIEVVGNFLINISSVVSGVLDALGGLVDFIVGVFTLDFKKAWEGIKTFITGIWDAIKGIVKTVFGLIVDLINQKLKAIKAVWDNVWGVIKDFVSKIWDGIKITITNVITGIKNGIDKFISGVKSAWESGFNKVKDTTKIIWEGIWSTIKGIINLVIGGVESMVNSCINAINGIIKGINSVAEKIPGVSVELIPNIPKVKLPKLAQGGFVKANTPQLAVIGDNKYQGEVVAPENKMVDMARIAAELAMNKGGNFNNADVVEILSKIFEYIKEFNPQIVFDVRELTEKQNSLNKRLGYSMS